MKPHIAIVLFIALAFASIPQQSDAATPVARWEFENNYNDLVGGYHLVQRGTVPFVSGQCNTAVEFDGGIVTNTPPSSPPIDALDATNAPNPTNFNSGFSVMGWMRHNQPANGGGSHSSGVIIAQTGWLTINDRGWDVSVSHDGTLSISPRDGPSYSNSATTTTAIPTNQWTHFAVTWNGASANGFAFYINGVLVGHTIISSGGVFSGFPDMQIPLFLGATPPGAPVGAIEHGYVGQLDDISLWTGALTPSEVQADYLASSCPPNLSIRVSAVELCWNTAPNLVYQLQYRTNLDNPWLPLGGLLSGDGSRFCTNDMVLDGQPQRFYQLSVTNAP